MIFVLAGTADGRGLVGALLRAGYPVTASVTSGYGAQLLRADGGMGLKIQQEPLDAAGLVAYTRAHGVTLLIDASHPYAVHASENAMQAARTLGLPYLRYERDLTALDYEKIHVVHSYEAAAETAGRLGETIFLTTGSHNLKAFAAAPALVGKNIIARVLPESTVLKECEALGLNAKQIVALEGPFSIELNRALFQQYHAEVIVTKNSGAVGGTDTKIEAARALGLPVVLIDRPVLSYPEVAHTYEEALAFVAAHGQREA